MNIAGFRNIRDRRCAVIKAQPSNKNRKIVVKKADGRIWRITPKSQKDEVAVSVA